MFNSLHWYKLKANFTFHRPNCKTRFCRTDDCASQAVRLPIQPDWNVRERCPELGTATRPSFESRGDPESTNCCKKTG